MNIPGPTELEFSSNDSEPELDIGVGGPELFESFIQSYDMHALLLNQRFMSSARIQVTYVTEFLVRPATLRLLLEIAFVISCDDEYIRHFLFTDCFASSGSTTDFEPSKTIIEDIQKPILSQLDYYIRIPKQERLDMLDAAMELFELCLRDERTIAAIKEYRLLQRYPFTVVSRRNCFPVVRSLEHSSSTNKVPTQVYKAFSRIIRSLCTQQSSTVLLLDVLQDSIPKMNPSEAVDNWNYLTAWFSNADNPDIMGSLISFVVDSQSFLSTDVKQKMATLLTNLDFATFLCRLLVARNPAEVPADAGQMVSEVLIAILSATTCDELRLEVIKCLPSLAENVFTVDHQGVNVWRMKYTGRTLVAGVRAIIYMARLLHEDCYGKPQSVVSKELKQINYLRSIFQKVLGMIKCVGYRLRMLIKEGIETERQGKSDISMENVDMVSSRNMGTGDNLAMVVIDSLADLQNDQSRSIIMHHDDDAIHLKGTIPSPEHSRSLQRQAEFVSELNRPMGQFSLAQYAILETLARLLLLSADIRDFLCVSKNTGPSLSLNAGTLTMNSPLIDTSSVDQYQTNFPYSATSGVGGADAVDFKKTFCFSNGGHYPLSPLQIAECYAKNGIPDAVLLTMIAYPNCTICHFLGTRIIIPMLEYNGHAPHVVHSIISETCLLKFLELYVGQNTDDLATSFTLSTTSIGVFLVSIAANIVRLAGNVPDSRWRNRKFDHLLSLKLSPVHNSPVLHQQYIPLTLDELSCSLRTSSTATNTILQKISNSVRFRTFSERVLRTSLWAHLSFYDSTDEFETMLHQMLHLSPCSEPPPSPIKSIMPENVHILRLDDGRKSKGKAVPIIPQTQFFRKSQISVMRKYNDEGHGSIVPTRHHVSGAFLPSIDKRKKLMSFAGGMVSNENKLTRIASYGLIPSDSHIAEYNDENSSRSVPVGTQKILRRPTQGIPILRSHDYNKAGLKPTRVSSNQQGCPLMSIRTLKNTMSSNN